MDTVQRVVVVGGGLAGAKTAEALRDQGFDGAIDLVGAEPHLPYERPPMSKAYLAGDEAFEKALVHTADWYRTNNITLHEGVRVSAVRAVDHEVDLENGTTLAYDKLMLATGAAARHLPIPGTDAPNVLYLRTVEDADAIRGSFGDGRNLAIIGGGWIGLEVAAAARTAGTNVTILEGGELPLLRVLGPKIARVFADLHTEHGVDLRTNVRIDAVVVHDGKAAGVQLADGEVIAADAVVIGVGTAPAIELAEAAGLAMDNGVLVDASLRTSDPDIYAIGDIANHDHPVLGYRVRVEHWATALNQPTVAASALMGNEVQYTELPYFYTDQYDLGCEYIGHAVPGSDDRVIVRGDLGTREFVAFWLGNNGAIQAAMNVNVWDVIDEIKPLIASKKVVDAQQLANPSIPYSAL